jgi:hypothetical protein
MTTSVKLFSVVVLVVTLFSISSLAQTPERRRADSGTPAQEQSQPLSPNAGPNEIVANEISLLRKSLQTLNQRLREISDKVLASDSTPGGSPNEKQNRIAANLEILTRAEQRAEALRKELLDRTEKETSLRSRLLQINEEIRPENIERSLNPIGTTRTVELRDVRRGVYENERRGIESLLTFIAQGRQRLEEDVRQADSLVTRLRQRILPLIDREIEKINPN